MPSITSNAPPTQKLVQKPKNAAINAALVKTMSDAPKKRKQTLPSIPKAARCGHCDTCLNPQWKKACLTVREQLLNQQQGLGDEGPPRIAAKNPARNGGGDVEEYYNTLREALKPLLLPNGGVVPSSASQLVTLMDGVARLKARAMFVIVIDQSSDDVRLVLQRGRGLELLHQWVEDAREVGKLDMLRNLLDVLDKFAIDVDALRRVPLGKTVARLKKHENDEISRKATALVAKWKAVVPGGDGVAGGTKRAREDVTVKEAKKPKEAPKRQRAADAEDMFAAAAVPAPPRPAIVSVQQTTSSPSSGGVEEPTTASSSPTLPRAGSSPVRAETVSQPIGSPLKGDAAPSRPPSTPGEPQPPIDANGVGNGVPDAQPSQEAAPISSTEAPTLPQQPSVVPVGSNEAADKEAAPPEKKKKKKTLSWNKDADLVQTRWFLKEDPPDYAKQDAVHEPHTMVHREAQFGVAARREHQMEAQLMRQQRDQAEEEEKALLQRLGSMRNTLPWSAPPLLVLPPLQLPAAQGEASTEVPVREAYEKAHPAVTYNVLHPPPLNPTDMLHMESAGDPLMRVPWAPMEPEQRQNQEQHMRRSLPAGVVLPMHHASPHARMYSTTHSSNTTKLSNTQPSTHQRYAPAGHASTQQKPQPIASRGHAYPTPPPPRRSVVGALEAPLPAPPSAAALPGLAPSQPSIPGLGVPGVANAPAQNMPPGISVSSSMGIPGLGVGAPGVAASTGPAPMTMTTSTQPVVMKTAAAAGHTGAWMGTTHAAANNPKTPFGHPEQKLGRAPEGEGGRSAGGGPDAHLASRDVRGPNAPPTADKLCAFFNAPQGCRNGNNCRFLHVPELLSHDSVTQHIVRISSNRPPSEHRHGGHHQDGGGRYRDSDRYASRSTGYDRAERRSRSRSRSPPRRVRERDLV